MLRIVAVADTHCFHTDFVVPDADVFLHGGDLLRSGSLQELESVASWIRALPHAHKVVIAGNHDWCFQRSPQRARALLGDDVIYLQDSGCTIAGLKIWGSPWQPWFMNWAFNLQRGAELAEKWDMIPDDIDILITHGPPRGYGDLAGRHRREGCDDLVEALDRVRPLLHCFGHIHEDGGVWDRNGTCIANVSTWECNRAATVFDFDPATRVVRPLEVAPWNPFED